MDAVQEPALTGGRISRYAIVDLIGAGGMGEVYRAHDDTLGRDVAIKVLRLPSTAHGDDRRRLALEARALSRVNHPHVAGIYDFFSDAGRDVLVMEFVPGMTLKELLAHGPLPLEHVVRLGRQILDGLGAAHDAHVVHRDIKPANVKVTSSGRLKILDFGLAQVLPTAWPTSHATTRSENLSLAGTLPYMSPEQLRGLQTDQRSDIFSVGAVLYELATGCRAFPQRQVAQLIDAVLNRDPLPASSFDARLPRAFERVLARAMAKDATARYATAAEYAQALRKIGEVAGASGNGLPVWTPWWR
jgi:serine/threonine protein kinase